MGALVAREDRIALLQLKASVINFTDENNFTSWNSSKNIMRSTKSYIPFIKVYPQGHWCFFLSQYQYSFIKRKEKIFFHLFYLEKVVIVVGGKIPQ